MNKIGQLFRKLDHKYGKPKGQWVLWCKRHKTESEREQVMIESILAQRTNWKNVQLAWQNLEVARLQNLNSIYKLGRKNLRRIENLIKPSGFYKAKAEYLFGLAKFIVEKYGGVMKMKRQRVEQIRKELLVLKGIGEETVDDILLYALDKSVFVIDEYTRRLVKKHKLASNFSYGFLQKRFEENLPKDFRLYQDFHALIVVEGKKKSEKTKGRKREE